MSARLALLAILAATAANAQQPLLTEWVESNPTQAANRIALGYPVPVPVDTPLPFDGFRTYGGLHARHQDLAVTTPWVHPEAVGATRAGRTVWAYRLGDEDLTTRYGLPEGATLTNGGIHAREWQTPETVTGILELMATHESDRHLYDYLRDNLNMVVIPVLNVDGLLQTQRTPALNYLRVDDRYPDYWPRDGRMRRKNMSLADEDLFSLSDVLSGVDLNRNNEPFWNTDPNNSSSNPGSLIYHGPAPASEPEIQALDAAAQLGPAGRLRLYTDVHSYSLVQLWGRNGNIRLATQTERVLKTFRDHHQAFPAGKSYVYSRAFQVPMNLGIGTTDEYFTHQYQVPSWTLEVEPSAGQPVHYPLPGCGADYGGEAVNCHDGFILPESEIRRVREELAQSFAAVYYRQAGPPSIHALRVIDAATGAVVHQAEWDAPDAHSRALFQYPVQALQAGRNYRLWLAFDKPMRWRDGDGVTAFPGQLAGTLDIAASLQAGAAPLLVQELDSGWLNEGFEAPAGPLLYRDDAWFLDFRIVDNEDNRTALQAAAVSLQVTTTDMTGMALDANPSTVADWEGGAWSGYESSNGDEGDGGGTDSTLTIPATHETLADPFVLEPGMAAAWYDPSHDGEGFIVEMLADGLVVLYWFTYDDQGEQDWYIAVGEARGNRLLFPELLRVSGGVFGDGFDPEQVVEEVVGSATFTFADCDNAAMDWRLGNRTGRQSLIRLSRVMGMDCGPPSLAPLIPEHLFSGSWYDPAHDGEGYTLEVMANGDALVFWFSYGPDGQRRWFFGVGDVAGGKLVFKDMLTTRGGLFGDDFDPEQVETRHWGTLDLSLACAGGTAVFTSVEQGFDPGQLDLIRLTQLDGLECP